LSNCSNNIISELQEIKEKKLEQENIHEKKTSKIKLPLLPFRCSEMDIKEIKFINKRNVKAKIMKT